MCGIWRGCCEQGSGAIKAGFAGDEVPKVVLSNAVGRTKHERVMPGALEGQTTFMGSQAEELRGLLKLRHPMSAGVVTDWEDMERLWTHVFSSELKTRSENHPVLLTESPLNPTRNRLRAAESLFETFNVPSLYIALQAMLSLYASGRTTGLVLDSGEGVTHAVPIYRGFVVPHAIKRTDIAGRTVTNHLATLLRKSGYRFHTSAELDIVRAIKESACYAAYSPQREEAVYGGSLTSGSHSGSTEGISGAGTSTGARGGSGVTAGPVSYRLPDGQTISVGAERFRAPEVLFHPHLIGSELPGMHEVLMGSVMASDMDLRTSLLESVVLAGGTTIMPGVGDRLLGETRRLAPSGVRIRLHAPPERKYTSWIGGSILASLSAFRDMLISAADYREEGANVILRRTF